MSRKYRRQHRLGLLKGHGRARHEGLQKRAVAVIVAVLVQVVGHRGYNTIKDSFKFE